MRQQPCADYFTHDCSSDSFPPSHFAEQVVTFSHGSPDVVPREPFVLVTPLTTTSRGLSLHVEVEPTDESGLDEVSYIQCELLRSINRRGLVHRLGAINRDISLRFSSVVKTLLNY
jgi:mRNA interferase MazF